VIDAPTQALLQEVVRRESRSLLQYLAESFPWTTPDKEAVVSAIQRMAAESRDVTVKITRLLRRSQVDLPYLGAFPMEFTTINFIGLDYALSRVVKDEGGMVEFLESQVKTLEEGEAKDLVEELLAVKRRHLKELEAFAGQVPATTLR
jgi:hypothetical protein